MMGNRSWEDWVQEYAKSHQNSINRICHTIGIPMIVLSLMLLPISPWAEGMWIIAAGLFILGWIFQFIGHAFEGKPPEFMKDWRFLLVGLRWWLTKIRGKA